METNRKVVSAPSFCKIPPPSHTPQEKVPSTGKKSSSAVSHYDTLRVKCIFSQTIKSEVAILNKMKAKLT